MKKIKLGRKEYFVIEHDELFDLLVKPMSYAEAIQEQLRERANLLKYTMKGANERAVNSEAHYLNGLSEDAGDIAKKLKSILYEP